MFYPKAITAWSQRGFTPGASGTSRQYGRGKGTALLMLMALAVRLTTLMPGVPVLHWHGDVPMFHAGGAIPHEYGTGLCGGSSDSHDSPPTSSPGPYYCPAALPIVAADPECLSLEWRVPERPTPAGRSVWHPIGIRPPGPSRGPPAC